MLSDKKYSLLDKLLMEADRALGVLCAPAPARRPSPAAKTPKKPLPPEEAARSRALMRVNHSGEICAQALYRGHAALADSEETREEMNRAAEEENDHLAWCEQRLRELQGAPSLLNPLWYGLSFSLGAASACAGRRWNLGLLAATEEEVSRHLEEHLRRLPEKDKASRKILEKMLAEERAHAHRAVEKGAARFPGAVKCLMRLSSRLMTETASRF